MNNNGCLLGVLIGLAGMGITLVIASFQGILWLKHGEWIDIDPLAWIAAASYTDCAWGASVERLGQCHVAALHAVNADLAANEDLGLGVIKILRWLADLWLGFYAMFIAFWGITAAGG